MMFVLWKEGILRIYCVVFYSTKELVSVRRVSVVYPFASEHPWRLRVLEYIRTVATYVPQYVR